MCVSVCARPCTCVHMCCNQDRCSDQNHKKQLTTVSMETSERKWRCVCHLVCVWYVCAWKSGAEKKNLVLTFAFYAPNLLNKKYQSTFITFIFTTSICMFTVPLLMHVKHTSFAIKGFVSVHVHIYFLLPQCIDVSWQRRDPRLWMQSNLLDNVSCKFIMIPFGCAFLTLVKGNWSRAINIQIKNPATWYSNQWTDISMDE